MRRSVVCVLALAACSHGRVEPGEPKGTSHHEAQRDAAPGQAVQPGSPDQPTPPDPIAVTPPQPPPKVKIYIHTSPSKMMASWGKKQLGLTPLTLERPRDSGPVDLVLRGSGYFPVHTRAYTVKNDSIGVKMTRLSDRMTLFGAKQEIPEEVPVAPPTPAPSAPAPTTTPVPTP